MASSLKHRPKSSSDAAVVDGTSLPSLDDLRRSQSQISKQSSTRSRKRPSLPRSHFGSKSATNKSLQHVDPGMVKEYSNPFLSFSESRSNSTISRPSLAQSLKQQQATQSSLKHTRSWSEGISDGNRAVRTRVRKLILDRHRPSSAPERLFSEGKGSATATRRSLDASSPKLIRSRPLRPNRSTRARLQVAARHPNRISEVPDLEAAAIQSANTESDKQEDQTNSTSGASSGQPSRNHSRTNSLLRKYSKKRPSIKLDRSQSAKLPSLDLTLAHFDSGVEGPGSGLIYSPETTSDASAGWTSPETNDFVTLLESPGSSTHSSDCYFTLEAGPDSTAYTSATYNDLHNPFNKLYMGIAQAVSSQDTIRPRDTTPKPVQTGDTVTAKPLHTRNFSRPKLNAPTAISSAPQSRKTSVVSLQAAKENEPPPQLPEFSLESMGYLGSVIF